MCAFGAVSGCLALRLLWDISDFSETSLHEANSPVLQTQAHMVSEAYTVHP